jgi:hypothetical protein
MVRPTQRSVLVEHWWNGCWGMACLDVHLYRDAGRWTVVATERRATELAYPDMTEAQARAYVRYLLRTAPVAAGRWREISAAHGRTSADI